MSKERLRNIEQVRGAEMMLKRIYSLVADKKTVDEINFEILVLMAHVKSIKNNMIFEDIKNSTIINDVYANCPYKPCEGCTNTECIQWHSQRGD